MKLISLIQKIQFLSGSDALDLAHSFSHEASDNILLAKAKMLVNTCHVMQFNTSCLVTSVSGTANNCSTQTPWTSQCQKAPYLKELKSSGTTESHTLVKVHATRAILSSTVIPSLSLLPR